MTEVEFLKNLSGVKKLLPNHPLLSEIEKAGFSVVGVAYLNYALRDLPEPAPAEPKNLKPETQNAIDDVLKKLFIKKSNLFTERAKLSNKLHDWPLTDAYNPHRAKVMDDIKVVQAQIETVFRQIEYYEANGELPPARDSDEKYPVPENHFERKMKLDVLTSSICRWKNKMNAAISKGDMETATHYGNQIDNANIHKDIIIRAFADDGVVIENRQKKTKS